MTFVTLILFGVVGSAGRHGNVVLDLRFDLDRTVHLF